MLGCHIHRSEALTHKSAVKAAAHRIFFVKGRKQLIAFNSELRNSGYHRRFYVTNRTQTLNLPFTEQVSAFNDFLQSLFIRNGDPAIFTSFAGAF